MGRGMVFYPTLSKEQLNALDVRVTNIQASYQSKNGSDELKCSVEEELGNMYVSIIDDTGRWSPGEYNLELNGNLEVRNPKILFNEDGLVPLDTVLGIGLVWKSKTSNLRGSMVVSELSAKSQASNIPFGVSFEPASIRGTVEVSLQLFVKDSGDNEKQLISGMILGDLFTMSVILEGINSTFTVFEKSSPGDVLWTVDCDWDDPVVDSFSDYVRVTINTAHPAWQLTGDEDLRRELLKEIMASSMQIVIAELGSTQEYDSNDIVPGSVCDAISYITGRAKLNMESNMTIAQSVRRYLDKSMK